MDYSIESVLCHGLATAGTCTYTCSIVVDPTVVYMCVGLNDQWINYYMYMVFFN